MTRIFQSTLSSGGTRKICGAHSFSRPMQNGHAGVLVLELLDVLGFEDFKSDGRLDLAGENSTHRLKIGSFRISLVRTTLTANVSGMV